MDLPEGEGRVLEVEFVRTPAVGEHVQHEFDDLRGRAFDEGDARLVDDDVLVRRGLYHTGPIVSLGSPRRWAAGRPWCKLWNDVFEDGFRLLLSDAEEPG